MGRLLCSKMSQASDGYNQNIDIPRECIRNLIGIFSTNKCRDSTGRISKLGNWRIDAQKFTVSHANIQIQRNGSHGKTSIAGILVPKEFLFEQAAANEERASELTRVMRNGLNLSLDTFTLKDNGRGEFYPYEIIGEFSS